ncbi:MAG: 5'-methylthioadenosine/adenosylhomocysteine nucleosidase [Lachnospiraceae bacterium]|nr:5'-methylthioadenosine/adenosylhomocysteine nucleosidase [Lachnospiraceae bacterium]
MLNKIGIIGAMEEEVELLIDEMDFEDVVQKAGMLYYMGTLCGKEVVIVECGIGKINAAICTQVLISEFGVSTVINTGVAGALDNRLNIGDILISEDTLNHDMDTTAFGDEYGMVPRMETSIFKAEKKLVDIIVELGKELEGVNVITGRVLSGDQFISDKEKKTWLKKQFNGSCVEMEGVAIGQTAYRNRVPFVILRAISDKSDGSAHMDYPEFKEMAIKNLRKLVIRFLEQA